MVGGDRTVTLGDDLVQLVDARITSQFRSVVARGTVNVNPDATGLTQVTVDGATTATPVYVAQNAGQVVQNDRVILIRAGSQWMVIATVTGSYAVPAFDTVTTRDQAWPAPKVGSRCVVTDTLPERFFTYKQPGGTGVLKWYLDKTTVQLNSTQTTTSNNTGLIQLDTQVFLESGGKYTFDGGFLGNAGNATAGLLIGIKSQSAGSHTFNVSSQGLSGGVLAASLGAASGFSTAQSVNINTGYDNGTVTLSGRFWGSIAPGGNDYFALTFCQKTSTAITTTLYANGTWWSVEQVG